MKDYVNLSKEHFNKQAIVYDENDSVFYSRYPKISCRDVSERLADVQYNTLLDIGCGTGYLINMLSSHRSADYYGLDLSPEMLKVAKRKLGKSVILTEGTADKLPYADNSFDVVTCIQSFHHYPYPEKAMKEAYRVLKPKGLYILSDTGVSGIKKWFENKLILKLAKTGDYAVYDKEDISALMRSSGFKIKEAVDLSKFIYTVIGQK